MLKIRTVQFVLIVFFFYFKFSKMYAFGVSLLLFTSFNLFVKT